MMNLERNKVENLILDGNTKYIPIDWPEIQEYMDNDGYPDDCYFDPIKSIWLIPEWWVEEKQLEDEFSGGEI